MSARAGDFLVGLLVLLFSVAWCWGVIATVPAAQDELRLGPRGFPLGLGVLLGFLGAIVMIQGLRSKPPDNADDAAPALDRGSELWAVCATIGLLVGYAALLYYAGFVLATAVIVALAVGPMLGDWRPKVICGFALGFAGGVYLIFGKLLGVYLPVGSLVNLAL